MSKTRFFWGGFPYTSLAGTKTKTASLNALIQKQAALKTASLNTLAQKQGITETASLNAVLVAHHTATSTLAVLIQKQSVLKTASINALAQKQGVTKTTSVNTLAKKTMSAVASLNAAVKKTASATAALNALAKKQAVGNTASLNALAQKQAVTKSASLNAAVSKTHSVAANLNAAIKKTVTATASLNALAQRQGIGKTASVGTLAKKQGIAITAALNAAVRQTELLTTALNAYLVPGSGIHITASLNVLLQKLETAAASLNAMIEKAGITHTAQVGALVKKSGATASSSLSASIQRRSNALNASLNAALLKTTHLNTTLSALLKRLGVPVTASVNGLNQKQGINASVQLRSLTQRGFLLPASISAALQKSTPIATAVDALALRQGMPLSASLDCVLAVFTLAGDPIIAGDDLLAESIKAIAALDNSYLFIQGPPGAGKTYTSAHVIIELLRMGKRIGVTANSHKAIHNLLDRVELVAEEQKFSFKGVKKCSAGSDETAYHGQNIGSVEKTEDISSSAQFLAGTAWLFADERFDQQLDYLIIEEAGQVSVANVVAMGAAAKNIILVGDQMQLGQPIQGVHPGEAGKSVLEFLLGDHATIPADRGIFLNNTRRLHPLICKFISDAFYDGRLAADAENSQRHLIFDKPINGITPEGIHFLPVAHTGCSQKSTEEAAAIKECYQALLKQKFHDKDGTVRDLQIEDILVVSPYNVQVNHLRAVLPQGARVGTVDKFQGQEAPVVLISMVTSSAEDLPRNIEFLYSKNRLNVAVSRAQCLAVIVANPQLMEIPCKTIEQMKLVNTFCWLGNYAAQNGN